MFKILAVFAALSQCLVTPSVIVEKDIIKNITQLPLDGNGRLADNWFLILDTPECKAAFKDASTISNFRLRRFAAMSRSVSNLFYPDSVSKCTAVSIIVGTNPTFFKHLLEGSKLEIFDKEIDVDSLAAWIVENQHSEAGWTSYHANSLTLYWKNPVTDERVVSGHLSTGETNTVWIETTLGHEFEVVDDVTKKVEGTYTIKTHSYFVIGKRASRHFERDVTADVEDTFEGEWARSRKVTRTFTELGFSIGKLPLDLWGSMSTYYYNNRENKIVEEWDHKGIFVNWWESDVYMIGMPWNLKRYWQARLQTLVEAWSGVELELTDIYGMRRYEDGARLLSHVDRQSTHATSLIINVAQGSMREPWAVEIYDFADRLHEVMMEEGDIVYYESARCLHGRMKPLQGAFYVNLFAHYRPKGDPNWYTKPNPSDGVPQLLDIGSCKVTNNETQCTKGLGKVPHLSPALETLKGPQDLFRYWKETSPGRDAKGTEEL